MKEQIIELPTKKAQEKAAQIWCLPTTSSIVFDPILAIEIARLIDQYREALIWCSGSADFNPGGQAHDGWNKICEPLL